MQFKLLLPLLAVGATLKATENPISKVLSLLDDLRQKVLLDGEIEQKQYEKYTEWCEDEAVAKQYQIKNGKAKIEDLSAVIEKATAGISNADSVIADLAKSLTANENDLKAAQEIRDKEHADFEAADKDLEETVDMLGRAIGILEKNLKSNSFAQISKTNLNELTQALTVVMKVGLLQSEDTSKLQGFLQAAESSDDKEVDDYLARSAPDAKVYESHSGSLIDTLEDMKEKAVAMRNDGQKAELSSKHAFEMLKQSLEGELKVDRKAMDAAKSEKAQASEAKATAEGDLAMTQKMVGETQEYLADMSSSCQQKANDWAVSQKSRARSSTRSPRRRRSSRRRPARARRAPTTSFSSTARLAPRPRSPRTPWRWWTSSRSSAAATATRRSRSSLCARRPRSRWAQATSSPRCGA
jgi:hypothetical protein